MVQPSQPALRVEGVSKQFRIPREQVHTLKERALHPLRRPGYDVMEALHDVDFEVWPGEFFGIVGRNGSGKSTLLKCMAGIYAVDAGAIYVDGRLSTFIELGVGFNPDLAAYDNVVLNATMLGLDAREARARYEHILAFAELEEFAELKLKNYSSGMLVRLAFSVMIQVDAEILLIDEVLAVGDASFQQKCFDEFARIRKRGSTVVLVTHDMGAVQRFCDRAMLLERGNVVATGAPDEVASRYLELNFSREARTREVADDGSHTRQGDGSAEIVDAWLERDDGARAESIAHGRPCAFAMRVRFAAPAEDPLFGVQVFDNLDRLITAANNVHLPATGRFEAGEEVVVRIVFDALMAPGRYWFTPAVARGATQLNVVWLDRRERMLAGVITGLDEHGAIAPLPFTLTIDRSVGAVAAKVS